MHPGMVFFFLEPDAMTSLELHSYGWYLQKSFRLELEFRGKRGPVEVLVRAHPGYLLASPGCKGNKKRNSVKAWGIRCVEIRVSHNMYALDYVQQDSLVHQISVINHGPRVGKRDSRDNGRDEPQ